MRTSGAAIATAAAAGYGARKAYAGKNEVLKIGLIGCGNRGSGAAHQALLADPDTVLFAMGDTFADQIESSLQKFGQLREQGRIKVDDGHKFVGFDAYKHVIDTCDVIVHATTPQFRPLHVRAVIEAGKHLFVEKPIAVDPTGVRHVMESCRMAKEKNVNVVSGLCYRYQFSKQATMKRIHDGEIGDIIAMETKYNTGPLWYKDRKPDWSEMEYQIRNWLYYCWLSGDHINEQHIHSLDKIAWAMGDAYPHSATASGGRIQRIDPKYGNIYDHFNTTFVWSNGVKGFSSCRQWDGSSTDVSDHIFGTKGTAHLQKALIEKRDGSKWHYHETGPDDMYQNEHNAFFKAIRTGNTINNGDYMCKSTLMAIMARMSAYTGQTITWDQALNSKLNLTPDKIEWGDMPVAPVPRPGITKFV